jgi:hypothetical protein
MKKVNEITLLEATIGLIKCDGYDEILLNPLTIEVDNNNPKGDEYYETSASLINYYKHLKSDIDLYNNIYETLETPDENYSNSLAVEFSMYILQKNNFSGNELLVTEFSPELNKWFIQKNCN